MKIKLTTEIKQSDGVKPIANPDDGKAMTLRNVCINALLAPNEKETGNEKYSDYELFLKIRNANNEIDLTAEEVVRIKKKIDNIYPALVLGQARDMLENKS